MEIHKMPAEATYALRAKVLRPGQPAAASRYPLDEKAVHFCALEEGTVCSTVTAHPENSPLFHDARQWRIRGMATEPAWQGKGLGRAVLLELFSWARGNGVSFFWCNARERAIPFYEKMGFQVEGDLFEVPGIGPHKVMWIRP
jgi:GNAT superfamily N-acetyltransferase